MQNGHKICYCHSMNTGEGGLFTGGVAIVVVWVFFPESQNTETEKKSNSFII